MSPRVNAINGGATALTVPLYPCGYVNPAKTFNRFHALICSVKFKENTLNLKVKVLSIPPYVYELNGFPINLLDSQVGVNCSLKSVTVHLNCNVWFL